MTITIEDKLNIGKYITQIPYATSRALNDIGFEAKKALESEAKAGLRAKANVAKAFIVEKSDKSNLVTAVKLKDDWHYDVLPHHYRGGLGADIGFERAMMARGFLSGSSSAVPIKKTSKNAYRKLLEATRSGGSDKFIVGQRSNDPRTRHLSAGVHTRLKSKAKPVILFTTESEYKQRFSMIKTVGKVVDRRFKAKFYEWLHKSV